jgi:hypothetical protein
MLSTVIEATRAAMAQISKLGPLPSAAEPIKARPAAFVAEVIPEVRTVQAEVSMFVNFAKTSVVALLEALDQGEAPAKLRPELEALAARARASREHIDRLSPVLSRYRTGFAEDSASVQAIMANLSAQRSGLVAIREHWEQELAKRQTQMDFETVFMFIMPIAKLASEIVSAITNHDTTEGALAEAKRKLQEVETQAATMDIMGQQLSAAKGQFAGMSASVQYLANVMAMLCGTLGNEQTSFEQASGAAAKLFLFAVQTSLDELAIKIV